MAAMSTALTVFDSLNGKRVNTYTGHSILDPRLVIENRRLAEGARTVSEYSFKVVSGTEDSDSVPLAEKVSFEAIVRVPVHGASADVTAALAIFRDIVAGDEFGNSVDTQEWLA